MAKCFVVANEAGKVSLEGMTHVEPVGGIDGLPFKDRRHASIYVAALVIAHLTAGPL